MYLLRTTRDLEIPGERTKMFRIGLALALALANAEQLRVATMGDSNTAGGAGGMDATFDSYPAQLRSLLGEEEWEPTIPLDYKTKKMFGMLI